MADLSSRVVPQALTNASSVHCGFCDGGTVQAIASANKDDEVIYPGCIAFAAVVGAVSLVVLGLAIRSTANVKYLG
jgi:hypothetical protein